VAEREVTIGYWPDGQARARAADSKLAPIERGGVEDLMVVQSSRTASPKQARTRASGWTN